MHRLTRCRAHAHPVSMAITHRRTIIDRFIIIFIIIIIINNNNNNVSPYERIYRRAAQDGSDYLVIVTVVCGRRRLDSRDRTTAAALPWRRDHVGATVVL